MSQPTPESTAAEVQGGEEPVREPEALAGIMDKPLGTRLWTYTKLSGPGWLQSAITLGGGSLASSLFLGMLAGFSLMWLQPVAMVLGVVMLSAIGYVALSTGERPFRAVNEHVNPVLGWGWALATAIANMVWCLPQFALGAASARLNLFPRVIGPQAMSETGGKLIASAVILAICVFVIWFYDKGSRGIRIFEWVLKIMVGIIIVCFFGVVVKMSLAGVLDWGGIFRGLVPDFSMLSEPAKTFSDHLAATGAHAGFWKDKIVGMQRDVMISAFATAVGINMTFLLPYSMLAKGWRRNARGLAIFDLSTGLFIPFILATGCVVIASATQFHAKYHPGLVGEAYDEKDHPKPDPGMIGKYNDLCDGRIKKEVGDEAFAALRKDHDAVAERRAAIDARIQEAIGDEAFSKLAKDPTALASRRAAEAPGQKLTSDLEARRPTLPLADRKMAAMLIKRSAFDLARSLKPLTGDIFSHYIFGIGVLGMAISSIIILMLISGFVVCEMVGVPAKGNAHRLACLLPCVGVLGPFIWTGKAQFWLAMPTSVFCGALIPIAYWTFFCMMNSRGLLGENMPRGGKRVAWNVLMLIALAVVTPGSLWIIWNKAGYYGVGVLVVFLGLALIVHVTRQRPSGRGAS